MADDTGSGRDRPSRRPDPSFLDRLADDTKWQEYETSGSGRRVDRQRQGGARHGAGGRPGISRREGRRRLPALIVLVVAVAVVAVVGLEAGTSESPATSGESSPFHMLPLDTGAVTSTVSTEPSSTETSSDGSLTSDDMTPTTFNASP